MNILKYWQRLNLNSITPIATGLLNETYRVSGDNITYALQKLNPIFKPEVNLNILAVTNYLDSHHFLTPKLVPTDSGNYWATENSGSAACWRLLTWIEGQNFDQLKNADMAYSAGKLLGEFHRILFDFKYDYDYVRPNIHDTYRYLETLKKNIKQNPTHPFISKILPIAEKLEAAILQFPDVWILPRRHSHGDLKASNILFENSQAISFIDFDTLCKMPWPLEIGDAFRSWCNLKGEDQSQSSFDLGIYQAALKGYQEQAWDLWTKAEQEALSDGIKLIALELCSRFLNDIFEDGYFKWNSTRFKNRSEHNWIRAQGQWSLYLDIVKKL